MSQTNEVGAGSASPQSSAKMNGMKVVGYTDRLSVQPGQKIRFMISCEAATYKASIVRLIHGDDSPRGPGFKDEPVESTVNGTHRGRKQRIVKGSYVSIPCEGEVVGGDGLTLQAWVYSTTPNKPSQALLTRTQKDGSGYGLYLEEGQLSFVIWHGGGSVQRLTSGRRVNPDSWYFVSAVLDSKTHGLALSQQLQAKWPHDESSAKAAHRVEGELTDGTSPLVVGARCQSDGGRLVPTDCFNGKIEAPKVYNRPLKDAELTMLRDGGDPKAIEGLVGYWDFTENISSSTVVDLSGNRLNGKTVNMPMRGATGHNWSGREPDFKKAPAEYGAIHFHEDDLDDAEWEADLELTVPAHFKSGIYAAHLEVDGGEDYVPFFVRPVQGKATAKIAFLVPTLSYLAYANEHMLTHGEKQFEAEYPVQPQDKYILEQGLHGLYDYHTDGSGVCYSSRLRPILNMRPKYTMSVVNKGKGSPHQLNADLHLVDWLEKKGFAYDVITDEDLHNEGESLLAPYKVVLTGTHPEYYTERMLDATQAYLDTGGRVMYLGANGYWWVTSINPENSHTIEIRRWGSSRSWEAAAGEYYLSTTGEMGGSWRNRGRPPQKLVGVGFTAQGFDWNMPYRRVEGSRDPRAAFIFEGVGDELIGDFECLVQDHGAAGFELDRHDFSLGTPRHALVLARAMGFSNYYQHLIDEILTTNDTRQGGMENPLVRADIVYFETPHGGGVFSVGSIAWCGCLSYHNYDNDVSKITENVLRRFASDQPLPAA